MKSSIVVAYAVILGIAAIGCSRETDPLEQDALVIVNGQPITAAFVRDQILLSERSQQLKNKSGRFRQFNKNGAIPKTYARAIQEELLLQEIRRRGIKPTAESDRKTLQSACRMSKQKGLTLDELAALYGPLEGVFRRQFERMSLRSAFFATLDGIVIEEEDVENYYQELSNTLSVVKTTNANAVKKGRKVVEELKAGKSWDEVANCYSEDKLENEKHEGYSKEWDNFTLDECYLPEVKKALNGADEGYVTPPLDTEEGLLIVRVNAVTNGEYYCSRIMVRMMDAPPVPTAEAVRAELKNERFNERMQDLIRNLRSEARMEFPHGTNFVYKIWEDEPRHDRIGRPDKKMRDGKSNKEAK